MKSHLSLLVHFKTCLSGPSIGLQIRRVVITDYNILGSRPVQGPHAMKGISTIIHLESAQTNRPPAMRYIMSLISPASRRR